MQSVLDTFGLGEVYEKIFYSEGVEHRFWNQTDKSIKVVVKSKGHEDAGFYMDNHKKK